MLWNISNSNSAIFPYTKIKKKKKKTTKKNKKKQKKKQQQQKKQHFTIEIS